MSTRLTLFLNQISGGKQREVADTLSAEAWNEMIEGYEGYAAKGDLEYSLVARKIKSGVVIEGTIKAELQAPCGRCDQAMTFFCDAEVRSIYMEQPDELNEDEIELSEDDLELSFYSGDSIDLATFLRESIILELDAYPRCDLEPDGTCPVYGHNPGALLQDSDAEVEEASASWKAQLAALKNKLEN